MLLPILLAGKGHEQIGDSAIYRYPKRMCRFFLYIIPVYGTIMVFSYTKMTPVERMANSSIASLCTMTFLFVALPVLAYFYFDRYRVEVSNQAVIISTIFGRKSIPQESIAQIVMLTGRATDLFLFNGNNKVVAKFGGSLQDFQSFLGALERCTRSTRVKLYRGVTGKGWEQRINDGDGRWEASEGPASFRAIGRRSGIILIFGYSLIAIAIALSVWLSHGGFDYLQNIGWFR
jgi:hypothetical protein